MTNTERHAARAARLRDPVYMAKMEAKWATDDAADRARPEYLAEKWLAFERDYYDRILVDEAAEAVA
ncbi:hypothetical protein [Mycobacterium sp. AT1]|uniref:hypothetical protein n=1 Tax=Mycobacterium sp. AT1 TaxID=1961706 RepID=UPI0009ABB91B|nr:hypothetical protein [Mycobacterium sp. AT1]OPX12486.1 hypothetical protein B1790_03285 [Mycobacterium sp. AT1]